MYWTKQKLSLPKMKFFVGQGVSNYIHKNHFPSIDEVNRLNP